MLLLWYRLLVVICLITMKTAKLNELLEEKSLNGSHKTNKLDMHITNKCTFDFFTLHKMYQYVALRCNQSRHKTINNTIIHSV